MEILTKDLLEKGLPLGTFLNVNIPDLPLKKIEGVRICKHGTGLYSEYIDKRVDPRNRTYYWQGCDLQTSIDNSDTDDAFLCRNYISITPIKCDMTDYSVLEELGCQHKAGHFPPFCPYSNSAIKSRGGFQTRPYWLAGCPALRW